MAGAHCRVLRLLSTELAQLTEHPAKTLLLQEIMLSLKQTIVLKKKRRVRVLVHGLLLWDRRVFLLM